MSVRELLQSLFASYACAASARCCRSDLGRELD